MESVLFDFGQDSGELPGLFFVLFFFVGTEEKQSDSSEHTFVIGAVSSGHKKGEVRWCQGDEILSTFLC